MVAARGGEKTAFQREAEGSSDGVGGQAHPEAHREAKDAKKTKEETGRATRELRERETKGEGVNLLLSRKVKW